MSSFLSSSRSSPALATNSSPFKFGTFSSPSSSKLSSKKDISSSRLFEDPGVSTVVLLQAKTEENKLEELMDLRGLGATSEEGWSVSVMEDHSKNKLRSRKKLEIPLVLYISTATSSLTLMRTYQEIQDLDSRLNTLIPLRSSTSCPLPALPSSYTKKRTSNVLATISRTLSPRRSPSSQISEDKLAPPILNLKGIAAYLTELSEDSLIRDNGVFSKFFSVRKDDLESSRVEKRMLRRAQSDLTTHLTVPSSTQGRVGGGILKSALLSASTPARPREPSENSTMARNAHLLDSDTEAAVHLSFFPPESTAPSINEEEEPAPEPSIEEATEERRIPSSSTDQSMISTTTSGSNLEVPSPSNSRIRVRDSVNSTSSDVFMESDSRSPSRRAQTVMTIDQFECLRVLGKGCAGKVLLVRQRGTGDLLALKAIHKNHVLAHRELSHTLTEQAVLLHCSRSPSQNPFIVRMHYSFHDSSTLYLALDFHPGGDLATQLARWGRLGRDRARFYTAEIVEGISGLHKEGVIYRDLKPENVLISAEGHIILTDFGLSKDFGHDRRAPSRNRNSASYETSTRNSVVVRPHWLSEAGSRSVSMPLDWSLKRETTSTFCGTAEYLAPEVLLGEPYSYEVDAWSLGTMLYEMLSGVTPFWSEDHADMYKQVLHSDLTFDDDTRIFDDDTKSLLRGLLQRNPLLRMSDERVKKHPYFSMIEWTHVFHKRYAPPFVPTLDAMNPEDTSQFDDMFLSMDAQVSEEENAAILDRDPPEGEPEPAFDEAGKDVFDGYSFYGMGDGDSIMSAVEDEEDLESSGNLASESGNSIVIDRTSPIVTATSSPIIQTTSTPNESPSSSRLLPPKSGMVDSTPAPLPDVAELSDDSDWDHFVDEDIGTQARNGSTKKESTLWSRGVKDRYKLLIVNNSPRGSSPRRLGSSQVRKSSNITISTKESPTYPSSPSTTPEPGSPPPVARKPLRRLASARSATSSKLVSKKSRKDLNREEEEGEGGNSTPRKVIQRLTLSAFRSKSAGGGGGGGV